jgi:hypothetical protein
MQNMIVNNEFKQLGEIVENRSGSVGAHSAKITNNSMANSPRANYTDRVTAAYRRSVCQPLPIEGVAWSERRIPTVVISVFFTAA